MLPMTTNFSPFAVDVGLQVDAQARQWIVIVVGATFEAPPGHGTRLARAQLPLFDVDVHHGAPDASSVRYDADTADRKSAVDVVVNGSACAPRGGTAMRLHVGISVGTGWRKTLQVSGDRFRRRGGWSSPKPFRTMPIVYERAFGGSSAAGHHAINPVGIGMGGAPARDPGVDSEVPNVEHANGAQRLGIAAGFGFVARAWAPRLALAGRYDDGWLQQQFPLVAHDFDPRFNQAAPTDQQLEAVHGGEEVTLVNMTPEGTWRFLLPRLRLPVRLRAADGVVDAPVAIDTVLIEPEHHRLALRGRVRVPVRRLAPPLEEVVVGHATPAWWLARLSRKQYRAVAGRHGCLAGASCWTA